MAARVRIPLESQLATLGVDGGRLCERACSLMREDRRMISCPCSGLSGLRYPAASPANRASYARLGLQSNTFFGRPAARTKSRPTHAPSHRRACERPSSMGKCTSSDALSLTQTDRQTEVHAHTLTQKLQQLYSPTRAYSRAIVGNQNRFQSLFRFGLGVVCA